MAAVDDAGGGFRRGEGEVAFFGDAGDFLLDDGLEEGGGVGVEVFGGGAEGGFFAVGEVEVVLDHGAIMRFVEVIHKVFYPATVIFLYYQVTFYNEVRVW
ncbi:MAG: hypothetical protein ACXQTS_02510 [Candidatus Methanospirareceae archaeon]